METQGAEAPDLNKETSPSSDLAKLRSLLLGVDQEKALRELLYQGDTHKVSKVLSEAILQRNAEDNSIAEALAPVLDDSFNTSINKNPQKITNAIYPIIGPAIRKAVASSLAELVQSLNTVLENSISLRAWGWRYKAWRAGVSYGEYVLMQTLDFRVEQILLIHRHTGVLLHSESIPNTRKEDPALVSSMLTAINDFVNDSFQEDRASTIDNIKVDDFTLEIEASPIAMLVAAVRGTPSEEISIMLKEALERVHLVYHERMLNFTGDTSVFASATDILHPCLIQKTRQKPSKRFPWLAVLVIIAVLGLLTFFIVKGLSSKQERQTILDNITQTPGYTLLREETSYVKNTIEVDVLRRPNSPPPAALDLMASGNWKTTVRDTVIGPASQDYLVPLLPDILQTSAVFSYQQGVMSVSGKVDAEELARIKESRLLNRNFARVNLDGLLLTPPATEQAMQRKQWQTLKASIESINLRFLPNAAILAPDDDVKVAQLIENLRGLIKSSSFLPQLQWQLLITGYADPSGNSVFNLNLSEERAELIGDLLVKNGIGQNVLVAHGAGYVSGLTVPGEAQRVVSLTILYHELPQE